MVGKARMAAMAMKLRGLYAVVARLRAEVEAGYVPLSTYTDSHNSTPLFESLCLAISTGNRFPAFCKRHSSHAGHRINVLATDTADARSSAYSDLHSAQLAHRA